MLAGGVSESRALIGCSAQRGQRSVVQGVWVCGWGRGGGEYGVASMLPQFHCLHPCFLLSCSCSWSSSSSSVTATAINKLIILSLFEREVGIAEKKNLCSRFGGP